MQNLSVCSQLICTVVCFHPSRLPYHQWQEPYHRQGVRGKWKDFYIYNYFLSTTCWWLWRLRRSGQAGWWRGPPSCWTRRGKSATAQSTPGWTSLTLPSAILMDRCVARSPKEMVRQVAATRELDEAEVGFANDNSLWSHLCRVGWSFLPTGSLVTRLCPPTSRTSGTSLASTPSSRRRRGPATWASPRLSNNRNKEFYWGTGDGRHRPVQPRDEGRGWTQGPLLLLPGIVNKTHMMSDIWTLPSDSNQFMCL